MLKLLTLEEIPVPTEELLDKRDDWAPCIGTDGTEKFETVAEIPTGEECKVIAGIEEAVPLNIFDVFIILLFHH